MNVSLPRYPLAEREGYKLPQIEACMLRFGLALLVVLSVASAARAGLYYSGETFAELPSRWRGFLLDQRTLRNLAVKPKADSPVSPTRHRYEEAAATLEKARRDRALTADETADLGAVFLRLGEVNKALDILRTGQRQHPQHFRIVSNLGTAWQLQGDLEQAAVALQEAVRLAPGRWQKIEELQLKLVRFRQRAGRDDQALDDLFGIRYLGENNLYQPGKLAAAEHKKLPAEAVALTQQLALWLPADGRLLWQLAELANAHGDVKTAAALMDGCVTEFGLHADDLRRHRQAVRTAADQGDHEAHVGGIKTRSSRPLLNKLDPSTLPTISNDGVNALPWSVLAETTLDRKVHPTFARYLQELDGKQVSLTGFSQPLGENLEASTFLFIENPVGCWYCEMPEATGIVFVELPEGVTRSLTRGFIKITGELKLNPNDPESFLYTISKAKVTEAD